MHGREKAPYSAAPFYKMLFTDTSASISARPSAAERQKAPVPSQKGTGA